MAIALVTSVVANHASSATTASVDTTGANLLLVAVTANNPGSISVSDNKGNSYTALTLKAASFHQSRFYYKLAPTVGSGHTVTVAATNPGIIFQTFSGVASLDVQAAGNATTGSVTSLKPGSVTPSNNDSLIITELGREFTETVSIDSGMIKTDRPFVGGTSYGCHTGYLIQTTAAAIDVTWSWTTSGQATANAVVFAPSAVTTPEKSYAYIDGIWST